jgi:hypothetical protein
MINSYKILFRESEGKSPLGRSNCRWENPVKMGLKYPESCPDVDWIHRLRLEHVEHNIDLTLGVS